MEWQTLMTGIIVGVAALIVSRRFLGILLSKPGKACGSCHSCSAKAPGPSATPLVQLGSPKGERS